MRGFQHLLTTNSTGEGLKHTFCNLSFLQFLPKLLKEYVPRSYIDSLSLIQTYNSLYVGTSLCVHAQKDALMQFHFLYSLQKTTKIVFIFHRL